MRGCHWRACRAAGVACRALAWRAWRPLAEVAAAGVRGVPCRAVAWRAWLPRAWWGYRQRGVQGCAGLCRAVPCRAVPCCAVPCRKGQNLKLRLKGANTSIWIENYSKHQTRSMLNEETSFLFLLRANRTHGCVSFTPNVTGHTMVRPVPTRAAKTVVEKPRGRAVQAISGRQRKPAHVGCSHARHAGSSHAVLASARQRQPRVTRHARQRTPSPPASAPLGLGHVSLPVKPTVRVTRFFETHMLTNNTSH